ncbi:aldo/keto reductase [Mesorhizobium onobrychidis]|uniref:aldo/keto reductase n=1 Tax=Mesorhizobium onobrychidis TaxID=2775404 RepID=UPI00215835A1|nr:aldo/keto reductase [Mesorhizobium onobrychidis]
MTGILVRELASRDEIVLANAILIAINNLLRRLSTDHVDLYQIHRWDRIRPSRWRPYAAKAGDARYLGASSMSAWHFAKSAEKALFG